MLLHPQIRRILVTFLFTTLLSNVNADDKKYFLETKPTGANVLNTKMEVIGTTPFEITKATYKKDTFLIAMAGHDTSEVAFIPFSSVKSFPASASYCEPCRIEMNTASEKDDPSGVLVLRKSRVMPEGDNILMIRTIVDVFKFEFGDSTIVGKIEGKPKKWGDKKFKELYDRQYHDNFPVTTGLQGSYLSLILYDNSAKDKIPIRFRLKGKFKNLSINFTDQDHNQMRGNSSMDSEFEIYNKLDTVSPIATYKFHSSIYRTKNKRTNFVSSLIHDAELQLMAIDTLYEFLSKKNIEAKEKSSGKEMVLNRPPHLSFTNLKEINRHSSPNVITIDCGESFGSGFFISDSGYLVTNYHVIEDEPKITIIINKNLKLDAKVIKTNEEFDLALLKVDYDSLPGLWFADSDSVESGDPVVAIGTPLDRNLSSTLTKGIVSGLRNFDGIKMIQTDVSINSGNSGGPLINEKGEVIGMATAKIKANNVTGIGFCIPSNEIIKRLNIVYK